MCAKKAKRTYDADPCWARVFGPLAATYATADRLQWRWTSALAGCDDLNNPFDLMLDSPAAMKIMVEASVYRLTCRELDATCPSLECGHVGPETHGIKKIGAKPDFTYHPVPAWKAEHAPHTVSAICNGQ